MRTSWLARVHAIDAPPGKVAQKEALMRRALDRERRIVLPLVVVFDRRIRTFGWPRTGFVRFGRYRRQHKGWCVAIKTNWILNNEV